MAIAIRGAIGQLAQAVLGMPLDRFAKQGERTDAADGDAPNIPGGSSIVEQSGIVIARLSGNVAEKVERNSQREFKRLGIDLRKSEPKFDKLIDGWRGDNVDRVKSLVGFERDKLSEILAKGEGKTVDELRGRLLDRLQVSRSKADLLARDQVLKLNAKITRERHLAAGITEYVWTTAGDERVRERHDELDGETYSWNDPPITNEAGDRNHPGEDYQCRCVAYPVLPELGDEGDEGVGGEPAVPSAPEPEEPADDDFAPPAEPPMVERRDELVAALRDAERNGGTIRDILREQVQSLLPETVSQDTVRGRSRSNAIRFDGRALQALGANAAHGFDGEIVISKSLAERATRSLKQLGQDGFKSVADRDAVRALLHEEMHGHSRVSPASYHGIGLKIEEVGTELNARRLTAEVFAEPVKLGSYQAYIDQVTGAVREGMLSTGTRILIEDAEKLIADAHVKAACSGGELFSSPTEALLEFVQALDVTPPQRAAILEALRKL